LYLYASAKKAGKRLSIPEIALAMRKFGTYARMRFSDFAGAFDNQRFRGMKGRIIG
jgi:hypothetical protein